MGRGLWELPPGCLRKGKGEERNGGEKKEIEEFTDFFKTLDQMVGGSVQETESPEALSAGSRGLGAGGGLEGNRQEAEIN